MSDRGAITAAAVDSVEPEGLDELLRRLAASASDGDAAAMDVLLYAVDSRRLAEPAIRRIIFEPADVADVSQNVLIAVAEHIGSYRGDSKFTTWLFGVARNKSLEHLRRKKDEAEFKTELGESARISSMIATTLSMQELLELLPEKYRQAVTLRDIEGLSYADIAERLDLNLNTVRAHLHRGRALLASSATHLS